MKSSQSIDHDYSEDNLKSQVLELNHLLSQAEEKSVPEDYYPCIDQTISLLETGKIRVAEPLQHQSDSPMDVRSIDQDKSWKTNVWVKNAILYYFKIAKMTNMQVGDFAYHDKIPVQQNYASKQVRVVPPATARHGSYLAPGVVLMPSYVNIGAYVDSGTMVDTWATVGSCAQIGKRVHLSGGVGIGGVLEPPQSSPVIVEDGAFIGSRAIIVEGVRIKSQAVIAANVTLTSSTPIIDYTTDEPVTYKGIVPARSVVVPGVRPKKFSSGTAYLSCAYIIGKRKPSTDEKTSLNEVLREYNISL